MAPPPAATGAAARAAAMTPWRRRGLLVVAGASTALALPPLHLVPVLWLAFPVLLWLMEADPRPSRGFAAGWWFGVGHFAAGLYWVSHALLIDPWRHGWLIPLALLGLGCGLGVFTGLASLAARLLSPPGLRRVVAFAGAWTLAEWLRGWLFTGFPWNLVATVWTPAEGMLQSAAWIGAFGLGLLTVAAAAMPAAFVWLPPRRAAAAVLAALLPLGLAWALGAQRLPDGAAATVPDVRLRLVQAGIEQATKWSPELRAAHVRDQVALSRAAGFDAVTHVVWPESAVPFFLDLDANARALVAQAAPPGGAVITGTIRRTPPEAGGFKVWNSLMAVNAAGEVVAGYDKVHLVPFGEYVPLRALIPAGIEKLTAGSTDFSPGPARVALSVPGAPAFSPLICYEIIFPGAVLGPGARPGWILNLTNDGWFGLSAGPYQHFASSRLRAVEEGLPVVRAANTGISAVVDPYGRVVAGLGLGERGVVDAPLPQALPQTVFARLGNALPVGIAVIAVLFGLRRRGFVQEH